MAESKTDIFDLASTCGFLDPLTRYPPKTEEALSALLVIHHQNNSINWRRVPLYPIDPGPPTGTASELLSQPGHIVAEYPLLHSNEYEMRIWGGMRADILYVAADSLRVVLFENKVGAGFTHGPGPKDGQLARQMEYLKRTRPTEKHFVLLSTKTLLEVKGWYRKEFADALTYDDRSRDIKGYLMEWEEVLAAFSAIVH